MARGSVEGNVEIREAETCEKSVRWIDKEMKSDSHLRGIRILRTES